MNRSIDACENELKIIDDLLEKDEEEWTGPQKRKYGDHDQLRDKEKQLRDEKKQLRDKELKLLDQDKKNQASHDESGTDYHEGLNLLAEAKQAFHAPFRGVSHRALFMFLNACMCAWNPNVWYSLFVSMLLSSGEGKSRSAIELKEFTYVSYLSMGKNAGYPTLSPIAENLLPMFKSKNISQCEVIWLAYLTVVCEMTMAAIKKKISKDFFVRIMTEYDEPPSITYGLESEEWLKHVNMIYKCASQRIQALYDEYDRSPSESLLLLLRECVRDRFRALKNQMMGKSYKFHTTDLPSKPTIS